MKFEEAVRHLELGARQQSERHFEQARQTFLNVLASLDVPGPSAVRSKARRGLAKIVRKQGLTDEAHIHIEHALEIDTALGDESGMMADLEFLGGLYLSQGLLDKAEHVIRRALETCSRFDPDAVTATACGNLGLILKKRGRNREARQLFLKSLRIAKKLGRDDIASIQYANLASICARLGRPVRAGILLEKAAQIFRKLRMEGDLARAVHALRCLGGVAPEVSRVTDRDSL